ncbi:MAG: hypothetical protein HQL84_07275 [Magnetococcales bacterium]|nr:hypothetical protein [Magnetococcales bacterium]MBF0149831.1 hypothetical protein [Magnetococcales bacterium]
MKRKARRSALGLLAVLTAATMGISPQAEAHDLVTATAEGTSAVADIVLATSRLVTVPIFFVLGLDPHPVHHHAHVAAPVAVAPVAPVAVARPPFVVATPMARPPYGGYYAQ